MPNKKAKCRGCKEWFEKNSMVSVPLGYFCKFSCAAKDASRRSQKAREKRERKALREAKERIKSLTELCSSAQKDVNRLVMAEARAEGRVCISCGSPDISDAGHFIHAGSKYRTSRIRFDRRILEPQCQNCNRFKGGMSYEYSKGIAARYGQQRLNEIDDLKRQADSGELEPLTKEEVRQIAKDARAKLRELKRKNT